MTYIICKLGFNHSAYGMICRLYS